MMKAVEVVAEADQDRENAVDLEVDIQIDPEAAVEVEK